MSREVRRTPGEPHEQGVSVSLGAESERGTRQPGALARASGAAVPCEEGVSRASNPAQATHRRSPTVCIGRTA